MPRSRRDVTEMLPLTHLSFLILLSLHEESRHGYAIIGKVQERLGSVLSPGTGTFYSALKRMRREGLVEETVAPADVDNEDARRRYYRLTPFGRDVLTAEAERLASLVATARELRVLPVERS
jgi:DNA-binding PadR family transcriptional regulator